MAPPRGAIPESPLQFAFDILPVTSEGRHTLHYRKSIRLPGYDYTSVGAYFVTLCTWQRASFLAEIVADEVRLTDSGKAAVECWRWLPQQYSFVQLDAWVIMPNHLHGILVIRGDANGPRDDVRIRRKPLGGLIGAFKTVSTQRINKVRGSAGQPVWQRNYYEHIIRNEDELLRIRRYVDENPMRWNLDRENPAVAPRPPTEPWEV